MWSDQRLWHGKHPEHHQSLWIPALLHAGQPGVPLPALPPARHTARWEGEKECPVRALWAGQQEGLELQQDLPMSTTAGAAPAGQGGRTRRGSGWWWHTERGGLQPLGRGFHQFPSVAGVPRASLASLACGRLGADGVDTALRRREGSRAFGSSGIFSPAASVLPPAPAATGTRRARPREATDEQQWRGRAGRMPVNPSHLITVWSCCYL